MIHKSLKVFIRLLGYIVYFISGFIPRHKNIWVFGSFGIFNDNSRYLYQYVVASKNTNGIRAIWISKNKKSVIEASKYGEAYHSLSLKGLYYSFLAKVYIFSSYVSDINFYTSRNSIKVNLWHGIPLKKIEFDITSYPLNRVFRDANFFSKIYYGHVHVKNNLFLSPSQYIADYSFKSAFRINDDNIIIAQYPRVSYLESIERSSIYSSFHKVFLYAPTWRDNGKNFIKESNLDLEKINKLMKEYNSIFLLKFHSATKLNIDSSKMSNIKMVDNLSDPMNILKDTDCLITDYSSIYFDYLKLNKPIIHFSFDLNAYLENRDMYFSYEDTIAGVNVNNNEDLINEIRKILINKDEHITKREYISKLFLSSSNLNRNDEYIIKSIVNYIENKK